MKHKRSLIIIVSVLFFLTALTVYLNRVVFPRLIKKIVVERLEESLKRKVEIGSFHFSWVKGFIIDKIKVYEKDPSDAVFAQADRVSFGIIIFPGFKHWRITIPFINVRSPSVHLIRTGENTWNFSDCFTPSPAGAPAAPAPTGSKKDSAFEIAWGGLTINDGKFLVDDVSASSQWSEYFDNINLKLSLSYKGISYDFTAEIPAKKGFIGATVYYQPITKNTQAQIHLKNVDTASYLSLVHIPDVHLESGVIKEINLSISYTQDKTSVQGDVVMKNFDISSHQQTFKGDIEIRNLDAQYRGDIMALDYPHADITARGQMALSHAQTHLPGLSAGGNIQARINDFELTTERQILNGSLHAQNIFVHLTDRQVQAHGVTFDNMRVKKDKNGTQLVGSINTQGLFVQWPNQKLQGDFDLKPFTMRIKDENDIRLEGQLQADHFSTSSGEKNVSSRRILLEKARLGIMDQKNISLNTKLSIDGMTVALGENLLISASIKTDKLLFDLNEGMIKASTTLSTSKGKLVLDNQKTIEASPQLELTLQVPLNAPEQLTYKGSITLSDASIRGFAPIQSLDNVELDADFQNDEATINALGANILDTNVRVSGTVKDFKNPVLNITAEADELDLSKIKDLAPQMVDAYGLSFDGTSFVKVKFEGLARDWLSGKILATASVKNVSAASSKFHQRIKNITGIVEATPDSLKWHDFTATYQGRKYFSVGSLDDFKNPKILATVNGPNMEFKADIVKNNDLITINALTGKYLNAAFDGKGTITLLPDKGPEFNINSNVSLLLENLVQVLPAEQKKNIQPLNPIGIISMTAELKGRALDWKNYTLKATVTSPSVGLMGYKLTDMNISIDQGQGRIKNLTFDGKLYDGTVHAVSSLNLMAQGMPYDLALNIDGTDLHKLKMDSPLKMETIEGKFYLTTLAHGTMADFKNNVHATGSLAIREGFLAEFNLFKGLLSILNEVMRLGQVMITNVEGNFTVENQKINTDNLRLQGPTIVLLGKGWVNFDQICDLDVTVDLSSGVVPAIAHDVLSTLDIHIYDKIGDPKFKQKISMPQVINTLFKNLLQHTSNISL